MGFNQGRLIGNFQRSLQSLFPAFFPGAKHDHYSDFGFPAHVTIDLLRAMFERNGIARAAVNKTILKTWQDNPTLWETDNPDESTLEAQIRQRFDDLRFWQKCAEIDRRSLVGEWAGGILRFADSQPFSAPVVTVPGGLAGLVEVVPVWQGQLSVSAWDTDQLSPTYGTPLMFDFAENRVGNSSTAPQRKFPIHPSRVIVWSADGTMDGDSLLEAGYNDLMTIEKIVGAGGEGFWKNAKSSPILTLDADTDFDDMARDMGVEQPAIVDEMNKQVESFNKGFDKSLVLKGIKAEMPTVSLPQPAEFVEAALQCFAASVPIPLKILIGSQTGERASTEDANEWNQTIKSRRGNSTRPMILALIRRLEQVGVLPERDWLLDWPDLMEAGIDQKIERAGKMATINVQQSTAYGEPAFTVDEIRAVVSMEPLDDGEFDDAEDEPDEPPPPPLPPPEDDDEQEDVTDE